MTRDGADAAAAGETFAAAYERLRAVASRYLAGQAMQHTLQPTALVHEAWLRLRDVPVEDRIGQAEYIGRFAQAMRHVLVDHARRRAAGKRGGARARTTLGEITARQAPIAALDVLALDEAIERLRGEEPELVPLAELRLFGGLSLAEAAAALQWPVTTARRRWTYATALLSQWLQTQD